jgi:hypothetical protein
MEGPEPSNRQIRNTGEKVMKSLHRIGICLALLTLLFGALAGVSIFHPRHTTHAQYGASVPLGFAAAAVNFAPLTVTTGAAGTVTNPASNFLVQVDGGPVWCTGGQDQIPEDNVALFASTTFLIVYNCQQNTVYAKTGITGPGSQGTVPPGVPTSLLFASFGEIPLATVVCNATACGNGGNGSITDARTVAAFPVATMMTSVLFANLPATYPNGGVVYCSNCTVSTAPCTGASTGAMALRVNGAWHCTN